MQIPSQHAQTMELKGNLPRVASLLLVLEFGFFMIAFGVLAQAIDWPASLGEPASVVLPQLAAHHWAVLFGYYSYLISAILLVPLAISLCCILLTSKQNLLLLSATAFGVLSGAMKCLGIVRWLFLMPYLADRYGAPESSPLTQETVSLLYDSFNLYAGKTGEYIGVQFFTALWVGGIAISVLRFQYMPKWISWFGIVVAIAWFLSLLGDLGISLFDSTVFISTTLLNFWYLALAFVIFRLRHRFSE